MTITPTAPSVTPCPVDWCPDNGRHEWDIPTWTVPATEPEDRPSRHHALTVLGDKTGEAATVEAEVYERAGGTLTPSVQIPFEPQLFTWQQANQVIDAIRYAATTAFGPEEVPTNPETPTPTPAQLAELDRWLSDPADTRTADQVRAAIADLGEVPADWGIRIAEAPGGSSRRREEGSALACTPSEQAVLFAVQELAAGRAGQNAVIGAWEQLQVERSHFGDTNEMGGNSPSNPLREINADGTVENHVFMNDCANGILTSGTEVGELIAALFKAGRLAFHDEWTGESVAQSVRTRGDGVRLAYSIRQAERAVLDAVRAWVDGDGATLAIENAYSRLVTAEAEAAR